MSIDQAYNSWADQYDSNENKTRDLEAKAIREILSGVNFSSVLEIGCGTGKNTGWFLEKSQTVTAVDFSKLMLEKAGLKINSDRVKFIYADIKGPWNFTEAFFDLISFSLVLEHIQLLEEIFNKASIALNENGYMYVGELHPFKQYSGTKARFNNDDGEQVVECYDHHLSEFYHAAKVNGLELVNVEEYFDEENKKSVPRILCMLFQKKNKQ